MDALACSNAIYYDICIEIFINVMFLKWQGVGTVIRTDLCHNSLTVLNAYKRTGCVSILHVINANQLL
jgi:hypothetical protein